MGSPHRYAGDSARRLLNPRVERGEDGKFRLVGDEPKPRYGDLRDPWKPQPSSSRFRPREPGGRAVELLGVARRYLSQAKRRESSETRLALEAAAEAVKAAQSHTASAETLVRVGREVEEIRKAVRGLP